VHYPGRLIVARKKSVRKAAKKTRGYRWIFVWDKYYHDALFYLEKDESWVMSKSTKAAFMQSSSVKALV